MYEEKLVFEDQVYQLGMAFPDDTTTVASTGVRTGGQEGRLAFVIRANEQIILAENEVITVTFQESSDNGVDDSFAAPAVTGTVVTFVITATGGAITYAIDDIIMRQPIPFDLDKWTKVSITCGDDAIDGELIDVFVEYLAN